MIAERMARFRTRRAYEDFASTQGSNVIPTKSKQLSILLLIWALVSCLGVAQAKDSSAPSSLLLANELGPMVDPANYLVSEKYDGVRAIWDGKVLCFRSGRTVNAPAC